MLLLLVIRDSLLAGRCYSGGFLFVTDHTVTSVLFTYLPDAGKLNWGEGPLVRRSHYITPPRFLARLGRAENLITSGYGAM